VIAMEETIEINQRIIISREFLGIGECQKCGGILFIFEDTFISFELLNEEEREKAREMVKQGYSLENLLEEFEDIIYDSSITYQCEKCGYSDSFSNYTTM
jgi:ssDNA-binding Zn-finger/Zn-ribbon topoisomerase 1